MYDSCTLNTSFIALDNFVITEYSNDVSKCKDYSDEITILSTDLSTSDYEKSTDFTLTTTDLKEGTISSDLTSSLSTDSSSVDNFLTKTTNLISSLPSTSDSLVNTASFFTPGETIHTSTKEGFEIGNSTLPASYSSSTQSYTNSTTPGSLLSTNYTQNLTTVSSLSTEYLTINNSITTEPTFNLSTSFRVVSPAFAP